MRIFSVFFALVLTSSAQAGIQDFQLKNETGFIITELNVSPSSQSSWGDDILGVDVLGVDETSSISISSSDECLWDVRITQLRDDGTTKAWTVSAVDLCAVSVLTFRFNGSKVTYTKE